MNKVLILCHQGWDCGVNLSVDLSKILSTSLSFWQTSLVIKVNWLGKEHVFCLVHLGGLIIWKNITDDLANRSKHERLYFHRMYCKVSQDSTLLSQPNNNHNPNNKTTRIVVGLRLSNRCEHQPPPPTTRNSKLHDRAEIEQNSENKSY